MKKAATKKKAPVQLTAGTGFRNENCIGARFLLDLLAGTNTLGVDFGKIDRLQWQGRDLGWLADDLIVECTASTGKRSTGISIKSDRQVTSSGFPPDFVGTAWAQFVAAVSHPAYCPAIVIRRHDRLGILDNILCRTSAQSEFCRSNAGLRTSN